MQPARFQKIQSNIDNLIRNFDGYLETYYAKLPFRRFGQLEYHKTTIVLRLRLGSANKAINDEVFLESLYQTLQAWGIGKRGSNLVPFADFKNALRKKEKLISDLEGFKIDDPNIDANHLSKIWELMETLEIVENIAKLVANSKALHHILPDLIVPIDRAYTRKFFECQMPQFQNNQEGFFNLASGHFAYIARSVDPKQYVGQEWNTSQTKVLDNAIVGFILENPHPHL